ncbi:hypothetical protein F4553_005344 [Allocatelliglobosispora scoriae]|uniref:Uncharacterized protein n=1 Tax=Allocatelliglobosispora scoriae TaxID=643052 RepID=A0A841BWB4_9ACTN|nr:hypothetical protein [Allocatelliglobosispora scoriae]MBB5871965.1 hypothetical protein [Allocatelliglobosispora scoriae]
MSIIGVDLEKARREPSYRKAVWLGRLGFVSIAVYAYLVWVGRDGFFRASMFGLSIIIVGSARDMFAKAGIPLSRSGLTVAFRDLLTWRR